MPLLKFIAHKNCRYTKKFNYEQYTLNVQGKQLCCLICPVDNDILSKSKDKTCDPFDLILDPKLFLAIKNKKLVPTTNIGNTNYTIDQSCSDINTPFVIIEELNITITRRDISNFLKRYIEKTNTIPKNHMQVLDFYLTNKTALITEGITTDTVLDLIYTYLYHDVIHKSYFEKMVATPAEDDPETTAITQLIIDIRELSKNKSGEFDLGLGKNKMICVVSCEKKDRPFYILSVSGVVDKSFPGCLEKLSKLISNYNNALQNKAPVYLAPLYKQDISEKLLYSKKGVIPEEFSLKESLLAEDKTAKETENTKLKAIRKEGKNLKNTSSFHGKFCEEVTTTGHYEARTNTSCSESAFLLARALIFPKSIVKKMFMIHAESVKSNQDLQPECQAMCGNCKTFIDKDLTLLSIAEWIKPNKKLGLFKLTKEYKKKFQKLNFNTKII
jgi:hypothetical protein